MSSTSPPWYSSLLLWFPAFAAFTNMYLFYWLEYIPALRRAYVERHSGDNEDQAVKDKVEQIKKLMDRDHELREQGLLMWLWYWPHEKGLLVAMVLSIFWIIWFLLNDVILKSLLCLFMGLSWACRNAIKWCKLRFQRQQNIGDIKTTAGSPRQLHIQRGGKAMGAIGLEQHEHTA